MPRKRSCLPMSAATPPRKTPGPFRTSVRRCAGSEPTEMRSSGRAGGGSKTNVLSTSTPWGLMTHILEKDFQWEGPAVQLTSAPVQRGRKASRDRRASAKASQPSRRREAVAGGRAAGRGRTS